jgi:hypothetical protein
VLGESAGNKALWVLGDREQGLAGVRGETDHGGEYARRAPNTRLGGQTGLIEHKEVVTLGASETNNGGGIGDGVAHTTEVEVATTVDVKALTLGDNKGRCATEGLGLSEARRTNEHGAVRVGLGNEEVVSELS